MRRRVISVQKLYKSAQKRSKARNFRTFPFLHLTLQALCSNACPEQALRVERGALITFFLKSPIYKMSNSIFSSIENRASRITFPQAAVSHPPEPASRPCPCPAPSKPKAIPSPEPSQVKAVATARQFPSLIAGPSTANPP